MTKAELLQELSDIPDDAVICKVGHDGEPYEVSSIEYFDSDVKYYDTMDEIKEGKIVEL